MKNCHVCNLECEDNAELCPVCGAYLLDDTQAEQQNNNEIEPVLLATFEDLVSAEIFKDVLTDNKIPYSDSESDSLKVVFGGGFSSEEIYVDKKDFDKAKELYDQFMESQPEFEDDFFTDEE
ncbi:MAG: hypothetical protein E7542_04005 [Ruminococcaceae bacterium]|nr:hypothetical protein [Oscillospiraceae bacterium]